MEALERRLKVMDSTALSLCMDNRLPIIVFDLTDEGNLLRLVRVIDASERSSPDGQIAIGHSVHALRAFHSVVHHPCDPPLRRC